MASFDLEEYGCFDYQLKDDDIHALRFLMSLVQPFLRHMLESHVEQEYLKVLLKNLDNEVKKIIWEFQLHDLSSSYVSGNQELQSSSSSSTVQLLTSNLMELVRKIVYLFVKISRATNWKKAENVLNFIESLLQNLKDLLIYKPNKFIPVKEIEDVKEEIKFLRNFIRLVGKRCFELEHTKYLFNIVENLAIEMSTDLCAYILDEEPEYHVDTRFVLGVLSNEIKSLNVVIKDINEQSWESSRPDHDHDHDTPTIDEHVLGFTDYLIDKLRDLPSRDSDSSVYQINILVEELSFLRYNLMDLLLQVHPEEMKSLITCTQALIIETGFFVYMSRDTKADKEMHQNFSFDICNLLEAVDAVKQCASGLCDNLFWLSKQSDFPSTNELEFVDFLVKILAELMHYKVASTCPLKHQIETMYKEIVPLRKCFNQIIELGNSQMQFFLKSFRDTAHLTKYVIDSFVAGEGSLWYHKLGLFVATKDVKIILKEMKATLKKISIHASSQAINPQDASKFVGLKDREKIIELLTGGSKQLKIVSIVGMPGLGKTTLANSVYNHPSTNVHFHVRAWCCVSQVFQKDSLLVEILDQIVDRSNQIQEIAGEDVALRLYRTLKGWKYLIVIDDIWDISSWNEIKDIFPDNENGSRILVTTQHRAVALETNSLIYDLRLLSNTESCHLLWSKLFKGETCPPQLSNISKHIAKNCQGLPLAVDLIAEVLKRTERRRDSWEKVARSFSKAHDGWHRKFLPKLELSNVFETSYKHLPDHLKLCFLYVGSFPESIAIPVSKLIRLWISQGLVKEPSPGQKSIEQEAEDYLNELINRGLVMIARRSSKGGVKSCRVHDVLREFCSEKLEEKRFLTQEDKILNFYGDPEKQTRSLIYDRRSDRVMISRNEEWLYFRLFRGTRKGFLSEMMMLRERSLIGREAFTEGAAFGTRNRQTTQLDYHSIFQYTFLTVLELANVRVESSANTHELVNIFECIHLRYVAIRVRTCEIPSEITNLSNLETFLLRGAIGELIIPEGVWDLISLNHFLTDHSFFSFQHYSLKFFNDSIHMDNLKSISTLSLRHGNDSAQEFILRRLTGLKKLGCKFFADSWDDSTGCSLFPVLEFLSELESLKLFFSGKVLCPCKFSFPSNLKKLSMSYSRLPWDEISVIGRLPNLEVLKLLDKAFEGQQWEMRDDEFQNLKFLKLDSLDIELWNASAEQLPCLEQLVVLSCQQLGEIPSSFGEICTLQLIEVKWCSSSAMDSVKKILEFQCDMCNDQLNVTLVGSA